jgi:YfiH family protein
LERFKDTENDKRQMVLNNYQAIRAALNAEVLLILEHVYGNTVIDADVISDFSIEPHADAAVTSKSGIVLSVQSADCVPILLADNHANIIGAAHCSWRSTKDNVLFNTIELMKNKGAKSISAIMGPAIWQQSYEVDQGFYDLIINDTASAGALFIPAKRKGHYLFDLPAFCILKLRQSGVSDILNLSEDTYQNPDKYFSYRRDTHLGIAGKQTNMLSTIMISK